MSRYRLTLDVEADEGVTLVAFKAAMKEAQDVLARHGLRMCEPAKRERMASPSSPTGCPECGRRDQSGKLHYTFCSRAS